MSVVEFPDGERGLYEDAGPSTPDSSMLGGGGPVPGADLPTEEEGPGADAEGQGLMSALVSLRGVLGAQTLSEANKLLVEQATTLIQKVKASEEKEMNDAMGGKLSPGILRKAGGGGY